MYIPGYFSVPTGPQNTSAAKRRKQFETKSVNWKASALLHSQLVCLLSLLLRESHCQITTPIEPHFLWRAAHLLAVFLNKFV
jgi:hypothetical protein